jgi:hypothetical protein
MHSVHLYLNNALPQSPADISKTQKAIEYIKHFGGICRFNAGTAENGTHHITLILTNNNLSETTQWNVRLDKKLDHLNTIILSSKKDSDVKNINELSSRLLRLRSPNELPDLIVMCTHEKRITDILDVLKIFKNRRLNLENIGIHNITLTIMFDEADKNMKLIIAFLKEAWSLLTMADLMKDDVIRDIHFITATPLKEFWSELKKFGISKLKNINHAIQSMDDNSVLHSKYSDLMKNYRWLHEHVQDHRIVDMTKNPSDYATSVLASWGPHDPTRPRIVFAPADVAKESHYEMRDVFLTYGYWVYVDNSEKGKGKGFYNTRGKFLSVDEFRSQNNIVGEPYEMFKKWKELYPTESLAITGWLTIIRGITFNTTGFNFTNQILSACHMGGLANLIQVAGRADGDIRYVGKFTIHCPPLLWEMLDERIQLMTELHEKNLGEFEEKDFRPKSKREEQEPAWTVPYVIAVGEERYKCIKKIGTSNRWDTETILALIPEIFIPSSDPETPNITLVDEIRNRKAVGGQFQITQPDPIQAEDTYKKYITDFIQKNREGRKFNMGLKPIHKKKDGYQIFLDKRDYNIVITLYNGTKLLSEE